MADPGGTAGAADEETGQVVPRHAGKTRDVSAGFVNGQLRLGEQAGHQSGVPVPMVWRDKGVGLQIAGQPEVHQRGQVVRAGRIGSWRLLSVGPGGGARPACHFLRKPFFFLHFSPRNSCYDTKALPGHRRERKGGEKASLVWLAWKISISSGTGSGSWPACPGGCFER